MTCVSRFRRAAIALAATAMVASPFSAFAQEAGSEISADHLKAARAAITAIHATDLYDTILPEAAAALKQTMIAKNPDLQNEIVATVDAEALKMAARRGDLEREAAMTYARVFSAEELNAIATFYESAAGEKLIQEGPILLREMSKAAEIWQRGIARDLAAEVGKAIEAKFPAAQGGTPPEAPAAAN